jgi:hypothetical protein
MLAFESVTREAKLSVLESAWSECLLLGPQHSII